jgi:hypothetical protein
MAILRIKLSLPDYLPDNNDFNFRGSGDTSMRDAPILLSEGFAPFVKYIPILRSGQETQVMLSLLKNSTTG